MPKNTGMIENPFSIIDRRLNKIESLLVEIKNGNYVPAPKDPGRARGKKKKPAITSDSEKEVSNG